MLVAQNAIKISQVAGRFVIPSRTFVGSRPRVRIPFAEKAAHGVLIATCLLATPLYIACNIKNYRQ